MIEYQILVRLKKTLLKKNDSEIYGNCQVCNEKYGKNCIETSLINCCKIHIVFIFCNDCHKALNDICSIFIFNKKLYTYEDSYPISEITIKQKSKWYKKKYYIDPIWRNTG
jgi:hypothetical protein